MTSINVQSLCLFKGDYYATAEIQKVLELDAKTTEVKRKFWHLLDRHFLKGEVNFTPIREELVHLNNEHFADAKFGLFSHMQKIIDLPLDPDSLRVYNVELKVLKVIAIVGAIIFLATALLAFIKLHYNSLDINFPHLYLAGMGLGVCGLAYLIRCCYKNLSSKTEKPETYDALWNPIFQFIYQMPKKLEFMAISSIEELENSKYYHIDNIAIVFNKKCQTWFQQSTFKDRPKEWENLKQKSTKIIPLKITRDYAKWHASFHESERHEMPDLDQPHDQGYDEKVGH